MSKINDNVTENEVIHCNESETNFTTTYVQMKFYCFFSKCSLFDFIFLGSIKK